MVKSYCLKEKCTFRKQVSQHEAFCMLPNCIYGQSQDLVYVDKEENLTVGQLILKNKELGLIP